MLINSWIFLFGGLVMTFATNVWWLIPARLIIGFASGLATVVVPVYLGEIAPPTLRGTLGTLTQFSMVIGILMTSFLAFPLANASYWRWMFAMTPLLSIVQLSISSFLLESPRWLLNKDEASLEARLVIKRMRGFRSDNDVETEVGHFLFASSKHRTGRDSAHSMGAMWDLLRLKDMRVLVISAIVLQMGQQLCGINAIFYYSTSFFEGVINDPVMGTTLVNLVNVIATYVALRLMDSTERRTLILWSVGGMLVSTAFIIAAMLRFVPKYVSLFGVMSFVSFFEIGMGPIPWLIVAEMFDSKYVATAMSLACIVNWGCNFLVGLSFPFIRDYMGAWCFGPFGIVLVLTFAFTWFYLPETHGRSVEEIQRMVGSGDADYKKAVHIIQAVESYDLPSDSCEL
jgi:SP family facilitated glucose transporter-like MFS transporter 3